MEILSCCFTGHRKIPAEQIAVIESRTEKAIRTVISQGITEFRVGGALGYDTLAAKVLFRMRDEYAHIKVKLIYPFDGFTDHWSAEQQAEYTQMLSQYDETVRAATEASRSAYLQRDRMLVDGATCCICYCTRRTGGTAYTVRYAEKNGVLVIHLEDASIM